MRRARQVEMPVGHNNNACRGKWEMRMKMKTYRKNAHLVLA